LLDVSTARAIRRRKDTGTGLFDLNHWRIARMKKTIATALGVLGVAVLLSACGPDMKTIQSATDRAQADATKAEASANAAEASANQAATAAQQSDAAASEAEAAVSRANDAVSRLEAAFATSVTK
jgi:peptidoglycan hydrolase CwlO-like protein